MVKPATPRYNAQAFPIRPDQIIVGYDVSEGSGTTLTNRGRAAFSPVAGTNGTITTESWATDAEGPSVSFTAITVKANASGADYIFPRLTVSCKCTPTLNGAAAVIFNTSAAANGDLRLRKLADNTVRLQFNDGGTSRYYAWTPSAGEHHFIARVTETGFYAWMDGVLGTAVTNPELSTNPVRVTNGNSWVFAAGATALRVYTVWDEGLTDYEIEHLWVDPYLPYRESPAAYLADWVGTFPDRLTGTTVGFQHVASLSLVTTIYYRVKYATTIALLRDSPSVTTWTSTATPGAILRRELTGLTSTQKYYYEEYWSLDNGVTEYPLPGGIGSFNEQTQSMHLFGDTHSMQDSGSGRFGTTPQCGLDLLHDRTTGAYLATPLLRQWRVLESYRDSIGLGIPHTYMFLGDDEYVDSVPLVADTNYLDDKDADVFDFFARLKNSIRFLIKNGGLEKVAGNHDGRGLQHQWMTTGTSHARALQKQATVAMKSFFPMPTDTTYAYGGERSSDPDWKTPLGTSILGTSDGFNGVANQAWRDYALDDDAGLNATPLESYWYRVKGDMGLCILDVYRHSGTISGVASFPDAGAWRIGATQKARTIIALKAMRAAGVRWIAIALHTIGGAYTVDHPPDDGWYGRDVGRHIGDRERNEGYYAGEGTVEPPDQQWLYDRLQEYGVALLIKGHDHRFAQCDLPNGTKVLTLASPNGVPDWIDEVMNNSYGTPESLGTLNHTGGAIGGGVQYLYNVAGMATLLPSSTTLVLKLYQTNINTDGSDAHGDVAYPELSSERFVDETSYTPSGGAIVVPGTWNRVAAVYEASALTGSWWTALPQNRMTAGRTAWATLTLTAAGAIVVPTAGANHLMFECTTLGTTGAGEPTWPTTNGGTVVDGTVTWTARPLTQLVNGVALPTSLRSLNTGGSIPVVGAGAKRAIVLPRLIKTVTITDPPIPIPQGRPGQGSGGFGGSGRAGSFGGDQMVGGARPVRVLD